MNDIELAQAQATINELGTEAANLRTSISDGNETARGINVKVREWLIKLRAIDERANQLRQSIKAALNAKAEAARLAAIEATKEAAKE